MSIRPPGHSPTCIHARGLAAQTRFVERVRLALGPSLPSFPLSWRSGRVIDAVLVPECPNLLRTGLTARPEAELQWSATKRELLPNLVLQIALV